MHSNVQIYGSIQHVQEAYYTHWSIVTGITSFTFLKTGIILAAFHSVGTLHWWRKAWKICVKAGDISLESRLFNSIVGISSRHNLA